MTAFRWMLLAIDRRELGRPILAAAEDGWTEKRRDAEVWYSEEQARDHAEWCRKVRRAKPWMLLLPTPFET